MPYGMQSLLLIYFFWASNEHGDNKKTDNSIMTILYYLNSNRVQKIPVINIRNMC